LAGLGNGDGLYRIGRLGTQLILQKAVEDEVTAFLERTPYQRSGESRGLRNGYRPRRLQTAEGEVEIRMPQVRETAEQFVSKILPSSKRAIRTRPLEVLVIGAYVRGLSDRDIEDLLRRAGLANVSKSTVSGICGELREKYHEFCCRSLSDIDLMFLFLDAIYLPVRPQGPKEGVLVAWGIDRDGRRVLLSVCLGNRESYENWLQMGRDLTRRGLEAPDLVISDGAPGLVRAIEELWPETPRQRCTVHRLRNVLSYLPNTKRSDLSEQVRRTYWSALENATTPQEAEAAIRALAATLAAKYPRAAACLLEDLPALTVHLNWPLRLRKRLRSTNLLERSLAEVRRRTKVIGRFPGETSCLTLCWAVLDLIIESGSGITLTPSDTQQMAMVKVQTAKELAGVAA
jgi:putative transposase